MPPSTREVGVRGEELAAAHLRALGYRIVDRNFRTRGAELDLVAEENGVLAFVEVRGRRSSSYGAAVETIDRRKRGRVARAAQAWLVLHRKTEARCRFDVVTIDYASDAVTLLRDAFRLEDC